MLQCIWIVTELCQGKLTCRYLIQNLTGSHLWYWAGDEEAAATQSRFSTRRRVYLPAYAMHELKVQSYAFAVTAG